VVDSLDLAMLSLPWPGAVPALTEVHLIQMPWNFVVGYCYLSVKHSDGLFHFCQDIGS
jgi:hypothetical protein